MKLGIFLPNWIGDVVMATPALRALRKFYGEEAELTGIMRPYVSEVLEGAGLLDDEIFFHHKSKDRSYRFFSSLKMLPIFE